MTVAGVLISVLGYTQITQPARYEREQKNNDSEFIVVPLGENGITLVRSKEKYREGKQLWEITKLNTDLKEDWQLEIEIENRLRLVGYETRDRLMYLLYRAGDHDASDLTLFTIDLQSQEIKRYGIKLELSFKVTHFSALASSIILGGYVSRDPALLLYDCFTENSKIVPGFFISDTELLDLRVNSNNTFNTVIVDRGSKDKKQLIFKTFDATGALLMEDLIPIDRERTILSGITSTLLNDELLVTGTWTQGNAKQATGIYTLMVDPFEDQPITYYDFGQLNHFLDYQSPRRVDKLKKKSQEANANGDIPYLKIYASPMKLEEKPEGFALLTEVYSPSTSMNSSPYWNNFNNPYYGGSYYGNNPFMNRYYRAPYQYNNVGPVTEAKALHSSVVVFDRQGKMIEDYGLTLDDKHANGMEQAADFIFNKGKVTLAYKKEKEIMLVSSDEEDEIKSDTLSVKLNSDQEIIRNETITNSSVRFWYHNHFFVSGYHSVKATTRKSEDPNRYVFYINKITVD